MLERRYTDEHCAALAERMRLSVPAHMRARAWPDGAAQTADISPRQRELLSMLAKARIVGPAALAPRFGVKSGSISSSLRGLRKRGLVVKLADVNRGSQRFAQYRITKKGREFLRGGS